MTYLRLGWTRNPAPTHWSDCHLGRHAVPRCCRRVLWHFWFPFGFCDLPRKIHLLIYVSRFFLTTWEEETVYSKMAFYRTWYQPFHAFIHDVIEREALASQVAHIHEGERLWFKPLLLQSGSLVPPATQLSAPAPPRPPVSTICCPRRR